MKTFLPHENITTVIFFFFTQRQLPVSEFNIKNSTCLLPSHWNYNQHLTRKANTSRSPALNPYFSCRARGVGRGAFNEPQQLGHETKLIIFIRCNNIPRKLQIILNLLWLTQTRDFFLIWNSNCNSRKTIKNSLCSVRKHKVIVA